MIVGAQVVEQSGSTLSEWAAVGSAVAAALAAAASWRSVALVRAGVLPDLHGVALANQQTGNIDITIRNTGGGIAKAVHVMAVIGGDGIVGPISDGFLRPGEGFHITTPIPQGVPDVAVVLFCRDANEVLRAWSAHGGRKVYRSTILRRKRYPDNDVIFNDLYPNVDLRQVRTHAYEVTPRS